MAAVADLERLLERVFERTSARVFRARIQAVQLERRVERAMEAARRGNGHATVVPSRYRVRLHPADLDDVASRSGGAEALAGLLADRALEFARLHAYHLPARPTVSVVADPSIGRGRVEVDALEGSGGLRGVAVAPAAAPSSAPEEHAPGAGALPAAAPPPNAPGGTPVHVPVEAAPPIPVAGAAPAHEPATAPAAAPPPAVEVAAEPPAAAPAVVPFRVAARAPVEPDEAAAPAPFDADEAAAPAPFDADEAAAPALAAVDTDEGLSAPGEPGSAGGPASALAARDPDAAAATAPAAASALRSAGVRPYAVRPAAPPAARALLRVSEPGGREREVRIEGAPLTLGRASDNGLVIADPRVSRHHGRFQNRHGTLVYTDLGSTNGTRVNGVRVDEIVLGAGDRLQVGDVVMVVERLPG